VVAALVPTLLAQDPSRATPGEDPKRWQAVAPGRVEPWSGEIKITAPVIARVGDVLVKPNDQVFGGELMIRLRDDEARARLASAEAQVAMRKRARNEQRASSRATERRQADDAVADAERAVVDARTALDDTTIRWRAGKASEADVEAARTAYARTHDRVRQAKAELRKLEADGDVPLPASVDGQLNISVTEWLAAEAAVEKLMIRSPTIATVLQVNVRAGELAAPGSSQPLLVLGDVTALRVRAEVDERDFAELKVGQAAVVRAPAFRGREIAGKISSIAPIVDTGRANLRGPRSLTDVNVVEVVVDLNEPGPLVVGMKVDVYFRHDTTARQ
jgi:HlyD family secretion protein